MFQYKYLTLNISAHCKEQPDLDEESNLLAREGWRLDRIVGIGPIEGPFSGYKKLFVFVRDSKFANME